MILAIRQDNQNPGIPVYAYITDQNNQLVYLFAYLNNGYNFVYDFVLNGSAVPASASMFVYRRNQPTQYYFYRRPQNQYSCQGGNEKECTQMKQILDEYAELFYQRHQLKKPSWGGFAFRLPKEYIKDAAIWENFLLTNYPPKRFQLPIIQNEISILWEKAILQTPGLKKPL